MSINVVATSQLVYHISTIHSVITEVSEVSVKIGHENLLLLITIKDSLFLYNPFDFR